MHKYQPRIHLVKRPDTGNGDPIEDLEREPHKTFVFPEAIFTAVTAYQNQLVSFISPVATVNALPNLSSSRQDQPSSPCASFLPPSILLHFFLFFFIYFILLPPSTTFLWSWSSFSFYFLLLFSLFFFILPLAIANESCSVHDSRGPRTRIIDSSRAPGFFKATVKRKIFAGPGPLSILPNGLCLEDMDRLPNLVLILECCWLQSYKVEVLKL